MDWRDIPSEKFIDGRILASQFEARLWQANSAMRGADHVREVATNAGLTVVRMDESFLRMEYGVEVIGLFVLLRRKEEAFL